MTQPILLSGIQPSGELMIGNYIGSLKNWVNLQNNYHCFFPLVNMHAITVRQDPQQLYQRSLDFVAQYLACGIDAEQSVVFMQSHVAEHAELAWVLNCHTYMGELNRMTQFKDKSTKNEQNINVGLFNYPVLMAADILLYQADLVPVGADQKQHLELARNLAERMNNSYASENDPLFKVPEPFIPPTVAGGRIMALQEPGKKMSKSDDNSDNSIRLLDDPKTILKKLKKATTDSDTIICYDLENKPGISNLLTIFSVISNQSIEQLEKHFEGKMYGHLKIELAEALIDYLAPIQTEFHRIRNDETGLKQILAQGAEKARSHTQQTLDQVYKAIGFGSKP